MNARALAVVAVLVTAGLLVAPGCATPSPGEADAAMRAAADAQIDLAHGRPRLAFIGSVPDDRSALDPATGRVQYSIGCCTTRERIAYRDAYNDTVSAAADLRALTLERKATTRAAVEAALAAGAAPVRRGGAGTASPGGRFLIEVAQGEGRDAVALWCTEVASGRRESLRYLGSHEALVAFGAGGTTLFVRDDAARASSTYDLPSALFLEVFPDPPRER